VRAKIYAILPEVGGIDDDQIDPVAIYSFAGNAQSLDCAVQFQSDIHCFNFGPSN